MSIMLKDVSKCPSDVHQMSLNLLEKRSSTVGRDEHSEISRVNKQALYLPSLKLSVRHGPLGGVVGW